MKKSFIEPQRRRGHRGASANDGFPDRGDWREEKREEELIPK
ncbi:hypothetical protein [Brasilonema bromeliae]|nr:hypothetical protein [Brasilonema bromeliae]